MGEVKSETSFVLLTHYVDTESDAGNLVEQHLPGKSDRFGIVGLHTCGDLASTSLQSFVNSPGCDFICNVGCCYNHLSDKGFPMSKHLKSKGYSLSRQARMLAVQPLTRLAESNKLPNKSLLWRAVLEIILLQECPNLSSDEKIVGRIANKSKSFVEYVRKAVFKLKIDLKMDDEEIIKIFSIHEDKYLHKLQCFYQYRALFSPLIESIILVDRLLFLKEKNFTNSFLVQIFDKSVSPRSYGIVATK